MHQLYQTFITNINTLRNSTVAIVLSQYIIYIFVYILNIKLHQIKSQKKEEKTIVGVSSSKTKEKHTSSSH